MSQLKQHWYLGGLRAWKPPIGLFQQGLGNGGFGREGGSSAGFRLPCSATAGRGDADAGLHLHTYIDQIYIDAHLDCDTNANPLYLSPSSSEMRRGVRCLGGDVRQHGTPSAHAVPII